MQASDEIAALVSRLEEAAGKLSTMSAEWIARYPNLKPIVRYEIHIDHADILSLCAAFKAVKEEREQFALTIVNLAAQRDAANVLLDRVSEAMSCAAHTLRRMPADNPRTQDAWKDAVELEIALSVIMGAKKDCSPNMEEVGS